MDFEVVIAIVIVVTLTDFVAESANVQRISRSSYSLSFYLFLCRCSDCESTTTTHTLAVLVLDSVTRSPAEGGCF